jgi:predicted permease
MLTDIRYALRVLLRSPLVASVAALSLALGIGGAASVFTVLNAVVLRNLPVPNPQQLYAAGKGDADAVTARYSWPLVQQAQQELADRAELFAATPPTQMQVRIPKRVEASEAERSLVQLVSGGFFGSLRQRARAGRLIEPRDTTQVGANPVMVISDAYWQRRFQRDPAIIGRELVVGGASLTVIGVTEPGFFGPYVAYRNPDVWIPLTMQADVRYAFNASMAEESEATKPWAPQATIEWLSLFVRVPEKSNVEGVASALTLVYHRDAASRASSNAEERAQRERERIVLSGAGRGVSFLRGSIASRLYVLLAMVGVLVAITCGNVASLLVARASAREREFAVRTALGAEPWRVVRLLLVETLLLSLAGGAIGLLGAAWGRDVLLSMFAGAAAAVDLDTRFDWRVLSFAVLVTVACGVAASILPALRGTRVAPTDAMKAQARQVGSAGGRRGAAVGKTLVAAQMAFCLLLLIVASLFIRSMQSLMQTEVGFDRNHLLVARIDVRSLGYPDAQRQALYDRVLDRLRRIPGVESASLSLNGPLGTSWRASSLRVEGYTPAANEQLTTNEEIVTADYFRTVGLALVEGRAFSQEDAHPGSRSTIVNQAMARRFFPSGGAIGKRWSGTDRLEPDSPVIVGVVQDAKYVDVRAATPNMVYRLAQASPVEVLGNLEIRASAPSALAVTVRQALAEIEPDLPVFDLVPLDRRLNRGLTNDRLIANLTSTFGIVALMLACLGLYGTISYGVARRTTELGVRIALGADRASVAWLVIREAATLVAIGAALGLPLAFAAGRSIASLLHGVDAVDPASYSLATVLLALVAGVAAYLPARRASRIDPMVALRSE